MTDPSEHLPIIWATINKLNVPFHICDEAFSEGLVALTRAASSFDPQRGAQLSTWLTTKVQYDLRTWLARQYGEPVESLEASDCECVETEHTESCVFFRQVVETSMVILSREEHVAIFGPAWGLEREETREILGTTDRQMRRLRETGREKLRHQLGLI